MEIYNRTEKNETLTTSFISLFFSPLLILKLHPQSSIGRAFQTAPTNVFFVLGELQPTNGGGNTRDGHKQHPATPARDDESSFDERQLKTKPTHPLRRLPPSKDPRRSFHRTHLVWRRQRLGISNAHGPNTLAAAFFSLSTRFDTYPLLLGPRFELPTS